MKYLGRASERILSQEKKQGDEKVIGSLKKDLMCVAHHSQHWEEPLLHPLAWEAFSAAFSNKNIFSSEVES